MVIFQCQHIPSLLHITISRYTPKAGKETNLLFQMMWLVSLIDLQDEPKSVYVEVSLIESNTIFLLVSSRHTQILWQ